MDSIPVVDIGRWADAGPDERALLADDVDDALVRSGFLLITGHGIAPGLPAEVRRRCQAFFDLPVEVKRPYTTVPGGRGWIPPGAEANAYAAGGSAPPDLKESFTYGAEEHPPDDPWFPPNVWPAEVVDMAGPLNAYFDATLAVARTVMDLCAAALRIDPALFRDSVRQPICNLNVNRYPSLSEVGGVAEGQLRIAPHTDFGAVTILDREPGIGGLQVQFPDGRWEDAPYVEDALTVNIGDMLARWTGDRWRSTPHRVLPPDPAAPDEQLMSLVLFVDLDDEAVIAPIDGPRRGPNEYEPITAGAYLRAKLDAIDAAA